MSVSPKTPAANQMWGGRFATGPDAIMQAINASIGFDQRLYAQDIAGSRAHVAMLAATGILSDSDAKAIGEGLLTVLSEIEAGKFAFRVELEDIHLNIEARLTELIGDAGKRLHTARSRNDQVAVDFRLWVRDQCDQAILGLTGLMQAFLAQAEAGADWVMPGFTHLQTAQPVTWGHHMMAYVEMFARDRSRFEDARRRMNECPLGAAALAGTSFPIDRQMTAKALGFDHPTANSLDSVSDRDFFELLTSVKGIGNRKALRALQRSFADIAAMIEQKDFAALQSLPEIGRKTAETIVVELKDKVSRFAAGAANSARVGGAVKMSGAVADALVVLMQLGEPRVVAERLVERAALVVGKSAAADAIVAAALQLKGQA